MSYNSADPIIYNHEDPSTWLRMNPSIIAHDVGRSRDRSTAVIGGNSPIAPRRLGITEFIELPQGLYGTARASALAAIDRRNNSNSMIIFDQSNDVTYGEVMFNTFGARAIGLHIGRSGDGMTCEWRPVPNGQIMVYTVGRTYLLEHLHNEMQSGVIRFVHGADAQRAYEQLANLDVEDRETGRVYSCPAGQHDDLAISCAMLAWAGHHPHLKDWMQLLQPPVARKKREPIRYVW
jgi:hypothetical protein